MKGQEFLRETTASKNQQVSTIRSDSERNENVSNPFRCFLPWPRVGPSRPRNQPSITSTIFQDVLRCWWPERRWSATPMIGAGIQSLSRDLRDPFGRKMEKIHGENWNCVSKSSDLGSATLSGSTFRFMLSASDFSGEVSGPYI